MSKQVVKKQELSLAEVVTMLANHSTFQATNENSSYYSGETILNALCWKAGQQKSWKEDQFQEAGNNLLDATTQRRETGIRGDNSSGSEVVSVKETRIASFMSSVKDELDNWTLAEDTFKSCYKLHTGKDFVPSAKGSAPKGLAENAEIDALLKLASSMHKKTA